MALNNEQKYSIVFALCHPGGILQSTNVNYNSVFNDRLNGLDLVVEEEAMRIVALIDQMKAKMNESPNKGNVKRIGDIELDTQMSMPLIRKELNRLRNELALLLDVPNNCKSGSCMVSVCQ